MDKNRNEESCKDVSTARKAGMIFGEILVGTVIVGGGYLLFNAVRCIFSHLIFSCLGM